MHGLALSGLLVMAFSLAAWLEPWRQNWATARGCSDDILAIALGDSRKLFAKHAYVKADAYFHSGYYPSIYDMQPERKNGMVAHARSEEHDDNSCVYLGQSLDWIDSFSRHFYPSTHTHLGEAAKSREGEEREMLPWLRLSASLDPQQIETYVVGAYWLRSHLGHTNEAEQFLREGLRANPLNCELLFELGKINFEDHKDSIRARNIWELALKQWEKTTDYADNILLHAQILGNLARLEEQERHYTRAIEHLTALKEFSPHKGSIESWITELRTKIENKN
jgi:tetratricopeptide (TPR) repeat protein